MVVSNNVAPVTTPHPAPTTTTMAAENMDMDVDYSADQEEIARLQAEAERFDAVGTHRNIQLCPNPT